MDLKPLEVDVPDSFYREEWLRVIQPQDIDTKEKYIRASRIGRGTRLNRADRMKIWPVFEEYRNLLNLDSSKEVDDAYRDAAGLLSAEEQALPYQSVVVDEAQDMSMQAFQLMRRIVKEGPNDMFIVGDGHQRIYGKHKVVLSHCGINIRGRARKLRINYRTTEEIRRWAVRLLEGKVIDDLDGGTDTNDGYKSLTHGEEPVVRNFVSIEEQSEYLASYLKDREKEGVPLGNICVVARTNREVDTVAEDLKRLCIEVKKITADSSEKGNDDAVRVATMHRVKGLEFDEMALASINRGLVPLDMVLEGKGDVVEKRQADLEERALVYVAITRAKKVAVVLSYGEASPYLSS
jgi:superfamily I DNA/RNA helicase